MGWRWPAVPGAFGGGQWPWPRPPCSDASVFPPVSFPHLHLRPSVCPSRLSLSLSLPLLPLCSAREGQKRGAALPGERFGGAGTWAGDRGPRPTRGSQGQGGSHGASSGLAPSFGQSQAGVGVSPAGVGRRSGSAPGGPGPPEAIPGPVTGEGLQVGTHTGVQ